MKKYIYGRNYNYQLLCAIHSILNAWQIVKKNHLVNKYFDISGAKMRFQSILWFERQTRNRSGSGAQIAGVARRVRLSPRRRRSGHAARPRSSCPRAAALPRGAGAGAGAAARRRRAQPTRTARRDACRARTDCAGPSARRRRRASAARPPASRPP